MGKFILRFMFPVVVLSLFAAAMYWLLIFSPRKTREEKAAETPDMTLFSYHNQNNLVGACTGAAGIFFFTVVIGIVIWMSFTGPAWAVGAVILIPGGLITNSALQQIGRYQHERLEIQGDRLLYFDDKGKLAANMPLAAISTTVTKSQVYGRPDTYKFAAGGDKIYVDTDLTGFAVLLARIEAASHGKPDS